MTKNEFMVKMLNGLPKFLACISEYETTEGEFDLEEEDWWDQYISWVSLYGVSGND